MSLLYILCSYNPMVHKLLVYFYHIYPLMYLSWGIQINVLNFIYRTLGSLRLLLISSSSRIR